MLSVKDSRRSRSKSPGGRDRDQSRSRSRDTRDMARDRSPARKDRRSSKYSESDSEVSPDDDRKRHEKRSSHKHYDDESEDDRRRSHKSSKKQYDDDSNESDLHRSSKSSKSHRRDASVSEDDRRREKSGKKERSSKKKSKESEDSESDDRHTSSRKSKRDPDTNGQYSQPPIGYPPGYGAAYPPPPAGYQDARHMSYVGTDPRYAPPPPAGYMAPPPGPQRAGSYSGPTRYAEPGRYQYAPPEQPVYRYADERGREKQYVKEYDRQRPEERKYHEDKYESREIKEKKYLDDRHGSAADGVTRRLSNLAVGGAAGGAMLGVAQHISHNGGKPPASPLLESYKGTYQSMSPMPGALVMHQHKNDSDISDLDMDSESDIDPDDPNADLKKKIKKLEKEKAEHQKKREKGKEHKESESRNLEKEIKPRHIDGSDTEYQVRAPRDRAASDASAMIASPRAERKRVMFYDAEGDAKKIAAALEGTTRPPNVKPLIKILPGLSDDDIMALRLEYKNVAKVGGQGINIAKHIKMRVPGNLGKACYATALGRWESEAYWANSWYQGGSTRRELLIESLMGRSNSDIREIKNCFKDKRYGDDLERCMKAELKADKFRTAILLALEERRMPESTPISKNLVKQDVVDLHNALTSSGGETALIEIIVVRSDNHLRQVLKLFEATYNVNFARAMIGKSRNLVGETLAHVLNGALNRPMRDALLLHQAIAETAPGKERAELLISRLVRLHWEPKQFEKVKAQYSSRYGVTVEGAIKREVIAHMKTEEGRQWAEFCVELIRSSS